MGALLANVQQIRQGLQTRTLDMNFDTNWIGRDYGRAEEKFNKFDEESHLSKAGVETERCVE